MRELWLTKAAANRVRRVAVAAALIELARLNIPTDVQELLLAGDAKRRIKPGALDAAIMGGLRAVLEHTDGGALDA